ncbi:MAG: phosphatidate cytidylyltransferase [Bacteroidetes bacterium]|nr:phosphatidate cytidylyltransferase [Bacteroidota bacterium]
MTEPTTPTWPHGPTRFEQRFGNATMRVVTAVIAIPLVLGAIWLGGWAFYLFVALISTGALMEFYWLAEKKGAHPNKVLGILAGLGVALAFMPQAEEWRAALYPGAGAAAGGGVQFLVALMIVLAIATLIVELFREEGSPLVSMMATLGGVVYIPTLLATLVGLRNLFHVSASTAENSLGRFRTEHMPAAVSGFNERNLYIVVAVIVTIWICDSGAYYCGRAFGRHKLFERVSPKKTWEGAIGGAVFAIGGMIAFQHWLLPFLSIGDAVVLGAIVGIFGQTGDLAESLLKRDAGVKDSSQLIPGHGGLLDRFDSLIFVAPLAYVYLVYVRPLFT